MACVLEPLQHEAISQWKNSFYGDPKNLLAQNACARNDPFELSISKRQLNNTNHVFTHKVECEGKPITNQKSSSRCWIFAALNCLRIPFMKSNNIEEFEFSPAYLFYWDKIERCYNFLNNSVETAYRGEDLDGRLMSFLLKMDEPVDKPGLRALEAMKHLNKTVSIFKIPKIPQKKESKMEILTEERYIEELSKIIQKDFFPDLEKLKAQNQYLDALEKSDVIKLRELYAKYSGPKPLNRRNGYDSPATFETQLNKPDATPGSEIYTPPTNRSNRSTQCTVTKTSPSESLDSFLSTYTSEDNHSFQEIIEISVRKLRQKFAVLYEAETEQAKHMAMAMVLPSIEQKFEAVEGSRPVDMWTYRNKKYVMYVADGVDLTKEEKLEMAKRKQEVVYGNTRLQHNPFDDKQSKETITELAKSQAKILSGKIGVDGNKLENRNDPNVRGFSFVKTPSPCPGVQDSPLMTWGEIEGTPFRLDGNDTLVRPASGPSFRINETSRRENIALELAEKAGERMRGQKAKAMEAARRNIASPHIRSSLDRLATMSPAAKRLAYARLGIHDSIITPSPRRSTPTPKNLRKATPSPLLIRRKVVVQSTDNPNTFDANTDEQSKSLLTDDLLKIPDRKKASDFF